MGELGFNKIFGALLAVASAVLGLQTLSSMVFDSGKGHGHHDYASVNEWAEKNFAYRTEIASAGGGGGSVVEAVYDLGMMMLSANATAGERVFKGKCASCHTIAEGGANGTGPNLYNLVGGPKQHIAGFAYSGALQTVGGDWSYENLDAWLKAPSKYARGTNMAFAGLNRDDERANVIAYLAAYTPEAPAYPAPLPAEGASDAAEVIPAAGEGEGVIDAAATVVDDGVTVVEEAVGDVVDAVETVVEEVETAVEDATEGQE